LYKKLEKNLRKSKNGFKITVVILNQEKKFGKKQKAKLFSVQEKKFFNLKGRVKLRFLLPLRLKTRKKWTFFLGNFFLGNLLEMEEN
jgi:FKBP-type peptidyl-prolyl cis-trans isomerase 2